jgi:hypothetical protein
MKGNAMNLNHDEFWDEMALDLTKCLGIEQPDLKQAQAELEAAPDAPFTETQISRMVQSILTGNLFMPVVGINPICLDEADVDRRTVADMQAVLNRNRGTIDPLVQKKLDELRKKAFTDSECEDDKNAGRQS